MKRSAPLRVTDEVRVEIADLGAWGAVALLAEYDPQNDTVRVNTRAVESVRAARGAVQAARFIRCAVAHEAFHRAHPSAAEDQARRHAAAVTGCDPAHWDALFSASAPLAQRRAAAGA